MRIGEEQHAQRVLVADMSVVCSLKVMCGKEKKSQRNSVMQGKLVYRFHGGLSTGPKTELYRQICAAAKTIHGDESRLDREINLITCSA